MTNQYLISLIIYQKDKIQFQNLIQSFKLFSYCLKIHKSKNKQKSPPPLTDFSGSKYLLLLSCDITKFMTSHIQMRCRINVKTSNIFRIMKLFHIYEVNKEDMINYLDILLLLSYFITTKNIVHIQVRFF